MIIEFTGLPGSGKTTFHNIAKQYFKSNGIKVWVPDDLWVTARKHLYVSYKGTLGHRFFNKLLFFKSVGVMLPRLVRYCYSHKRFVARLLRIILLSPNRMHAKWLLIKYFIIDLFQYSYINHCELNTYDIFLLDEGFIQHSFTYFAYKFFPLNYKMIDWYLSNTPHPDLIINISVPVEACFDRMKKRGLPYRLRKESHSAIDDILKKGVDLFSFLSNKFSFDKTENIKMIQLDDNQIENTSSILRKSLSSYLRKITIRNDLHSSQ